MEKKQIIGLAGSFALFAGVFTPILSLPFVGDINFLRIAEGQSLVLIVLAIASAVLCFIKKYMGFWVTGLAAVAVLALTVISFQVKISQARSELGAFGGLADMALQTVQPQWGCAVLALGVILLFVAAALPQKGEWNAGKPVSYYPISEPQTTYSPVAEQPQPITHQVAWTETENYQKAKETLQTAQAQATEQLGKFSIWAANSSRQAHQWVVAKDVPGWVRGHVRLLCAIGGSCVAMFVIYHAFIKPSPNADGKKAALAYKNCQTAYEAKVATAYQSFLNEFAAQNFKTRGDAEQKLETLFSPDRQIFVSCFEAADASYKELMARYASDNEGQSTFSNVFRENGGDGKPADEISRSSSLFATVNEKIQSIRVPFPDANRIIMDLVGKSMDGWNFSYASEFKNVKIISSNLAGDTLIMRTNLDLEDGSNQKQYFAVLDLKYLLNSNGEWDYDSFAELIYANAGDNYFIDNEIFLVGKWRWAGNYATYNSDGTWSGERDDGETMEGAWRIVNGNLVLTLNEENWFRKKIVQFSKTEMYVGEGKPDRAERVE